MPQDHARLAREARLGCEPLSVVELEKRGVSRAVVRGPKWRRTSYGCFVPTDAGTVDGVRTPLQRIIEASPLVPASGALTGWASAYLAGVTPLDGLDSETRKELAVPICLGRDVGRKRKGEWVFMRDGLPVEDVQTVKLRAGEPLLGQDVPLELRATKPDRAAFDGARAARDLGEAVAFIDACANTGWISLNSLTNYLSTRAGARRIAFVRQALGLADGAARSTWESRLRVFYITVARLPRPLVNVPVFDLDGRLLGIADLLDPEAGLVTEFDGSQHRLRQQHRADNEREEGFEDAGLTVVRADSLDMNEHERRLTRRLDSGYRRGMQRDRRRDRWTLAAPGWWLENQAELA